MAVVTGGPFTKHGTGQYRRHSIRLPVSADELALLQKTAFLKDCSINAFIRAAVLRAIPEQLIEQYGGES